MTKINKIEEHPFLRNFHDNGKEKTLAFRVSKETYDLFKPHAEAKYGTVADGLKRIFLRYMSQYAFKRQLFKKVVYLFVPIFAKEKEILISDKNFVLPDSLRMEPFTISSRVNLFDINNIIISKEGIKDFRNFKTLNEYNDNELTDDEYERLFDTNEVYKRMCKQFSYESDFTLNDGVIVECPLNNLLDRYVNGIYNWTINNNYGHEGLIIFEFEEKYYYVVFCFETKYYPVTQKFFNSRLVSNEEAYEKAMECGNIELAKFIDNFNKGLSNIEKNKTMLLDKKEKLLQQINEIDEKLTKLK